MRLTFVKYFLFLWVCLLFGYNQSLANSYSNNTFHSTERKSIVYTTSVALQTDCLSGITHTSFNSEKIEVGISFIEVKEKEEDDDDNDDLVRLDNRLVNNDYNTGISDIQLPSYFFNLNKNAILPYNHFGYTSSNRYIAFQVFRI